MVLIVGVHDSGVNPFNRVRVAMHSRLADDIRHGDTSGVNQTLTVLLEDPFSGGVSPE